MSELVSHCRNFKICFPEPHPFFKVKCKLLHDMTPTSLWALTACVFLGYQIPRQMESLPRTAVPPGGNTASEPSRVLGPKQMLKTYMLPRTFFTLTLPPTPITKRALTFCPSPLPPPSPRCYHLWSGPPAQSPNWAASTFSLIIGSPLGSQEGFFF